MNGLMKKMVATGLFAAACGGASALTNSCKVTQHQGYTRATPNAANSLILSRNPESSGRHETQGKIETETYNDTENEDVYVLHFEKPTSKEVIASCTGLRYDLDGNALYASENTYPIRIVDSAGVLSKAFTLGIYTNPVVKEACHRNIAYDCAEIQDGSDSYLCSPKGERTAVTPN